MKMKAEGPSRFRIQIPEEKADEVAAIPGVQLAPTRDTAGGYLDGVCAAAKLLGADVVTPSWRDESPAELPSLRPYQQQGVAFIARVLQTCWGALLADDMGLGKTLQSISTARLIAPAGRILIAAPAAARETWREELAKWAPGESVAILGQSATKAQKAEWENAPTARWVVSSYDLIASGKVEAAAFPYEQPEMVILDEAHRVKGRKTVRSKALQQMCAMARYRLALTGTPVYNRPRDLWMLLHILLGSRFGNQFAFDERYCGGRVNEHGGWENQGSANVDELRLRLAYYMLRREKAEVATELPPLTRVVRWLEGDKKAKAAFERVQLGLTKGNLHDGIVATLDGKMEEAMALATESRRFLLTTWLKSHAFQFHKMLNEQGTPCQLITGEISTEKRQAAINIARSRGEGIVATLDSVSEAINMQGVASNGICHAIDWNPQKLSQMEARLHRIGQTDPVTWTYLAMTGSVDEIVIPTVVNKLDAFIGIMGAKSPQGLRDGLNATVGIATSEEDVLMQLAAMLGRDNDE